MLNFWFDYELNQNFTLLVVIFDGILDDVEQNELIGLCIHLNACIGRIFDDVVDVQLPRFNLGRKWIYYFVDMLVQVPYHAHFRLEFASSNLHSLDMVIAIEPHSNARLLDRVQQSQSFLISLHLSDFVAVCLITSAHKLNQHLPHPLLGDP